MRPNPSRLDASTAGRWVIAAALVALAAGCTDEPCTEFPCRTGADIPIGVFSFAESAALTGATISICHNNTCASGVVMPPTDPAGYVGVSLEDDVHTTAGIGIMGFMGAIIVIGSFTGPADIFHDGDQFTAEGTTPDGIVILSNTWSATYIQTQPNGAECGPICMQAVLDADH